MDKVASGERPKGQKRKSYLVENKKAHKVFDSQHSLRLASFETYFQKRKVTVRFFANEEVKKNLISLPVLYAL